jgi:hypothetical protein
MDLDLDSFKDKSFWSDNKKRIRKIRKGKEK